MILRLRPYKECDAKHILSWIDNEFAFHQWCADRFKHFPITESEFSDYYSSFADDDSFWGMTAFDENEVLGHLFFKFENEEKSVVRLGFIIIDSNKRGQGLGKEFMSLIKTYVFEVLKAERIMLVVFKNNPAAYYCYKAAGFKENPNRAPYTYQILNEPWECIELELLK